MSRESGEVQPKPAILVLVAGTFTRRPEWAFSSDSRLRRRVERQLGGDSVVFEPFPWTGLFGSRLNNAHRYRVRAGEALRAKIHSLRHRHPESRIFVIGHSHGGNVALYAVKDEAVARQVAGVVCLATPFFVVTENAQVSLASSGWLGLLGCLWMGGGFVVLPLLVAAGLVLPVTWLGARVHAGVGALLFLPALVCGVVLGLGLNLTLPLLWDRLVSSVEASSSRAARAAEVALQSALPAEVPVLCQLGRRDEVGRVFGALRWFLGLIRTRWVIASWVLTTVALAGVAIHRAYGLVPQEVFDPLRSPHAPIDYMIVPLLGLAVLVLVAVVALLSWSLWTFTDLALGRTRTLAFGWESIPETLFSRIEHTLTPSGHEASADGALDHTHEIREYELRAKPRHSAIYEDGAALDDLARWLRQASSGTLRPCGDCASAAAQEADAAVEPAGSTDAAGDFVRATVRGLGERRPPSNPRLR